MRIEGAGRWPTRSGTRAVSGQMTSPGQPDDVGTSLPTTDAAPAVPWPRIDSEQLDDSSAPLAQRFRAGDLDALASVYRQSSSLVFTIALRALASQPDAEEVTQRVYLQAWRARAAYDPSRRPLRAWLVGIARDAVADAIGERSRQVRLEQRLDEIGRVEEGSDDGIAERIADAVIVADGLSRLDEPRRQVVEMSFFEGLTHTQISEALGIPLGSVKSHLQRGLVQLRRQLE
jgi:RNA polymerase sigma factor (sigma-70 family)